MTAWRCPVCEAINEGGRVCTTCGAVLAEDRPLPVAARVRPPATIVPVLPPPPPPRPAAPEPEPDLDPLDVWMRSWPWRSRPPRPAPRPEGLPPTPSEIFGSDPFA